MHRSLKYYLIPIVMGLLISACGGLGGEPEIVGELPPTARPQSQNVSLVPPNIAPDLVVGAQVFAENCTRCHGIGGAGDGEFALSGQVQNVPNFTLPETFVGKTPADYYSAVTLGNIQALMPPFGESLTDAERWSVANYVMTLAGEGLVAALAAPAATEESTSPSAESTAVVEAPVVDTIGTITGRVIHGSTGGTIPADLTVTLHVVDRELNEQSFEQPLQPDGTFIFTDIGVSTNYGYFVSTPYNDATFNSNFIAGDPAQPNMALEITLYDVTDDPSVIQIDSIISQINRTPTHLEMIQLIRLTNLSDRIFRTTDESGHQLSVGLPVPQGATLTGSNDESRFFFFPEENIVYDTLPIAPNQTQTIHFIYSMPFSGTATLTQQFNYVINGAFEVYVNATELSISADGWQSTIQNVGDASFNGVVAVMDNLPEATLTYTVSDVAKPFSIDQSFMGTLLLVIGASLILLAIVLYIFSNRKGNEPKTPENDQAQALLEQISALDDLYANQKISKSAYDRKRKTLKESLAVVLKTVK